MNPYRKILVAVDGSPASEKGLREALRLAGGEGSSLCILHVVDNLPAFAGVAPADWMDLLPALRENGRQILAQARATAEKAGVAASAVLRETAGGAAADVIVAEAKKLEAELIVLGTHGRRGMRRLVLGSDSEQVVRTSPVPVLLVRG
jgi:nucleotide-binding universal stress UspA family protein